MPTENSLALEIKRVLILRLVLSIQANLRDSFDFSGPPSFHLKNDDLSYFLEISQELVKAVIMTAVWKPFVICSYVRGREVHCKEGKSNGEHT